MIQNESSPARGGDAGDGLGNTIRRNLDRQFKIEAQSKRQEKLSADAHIVAELFEDAADTTRRMQATLSRAQAAASQRDLSAELGGVRRRIDEVFLAID